MCNIIDVLSAMLTPLIAVIALWIAYRQWRTSKDTHQLNLYEKRYSIYRALKDALLEIGREANISRKGLDQLIIKTGESVFIFDNDVVNYIKNFRENALRLLQVNRRLSDSSSLSGDEMKKLASEAEKLEKWFAGQHEESIDKFMAYLKFRK